MEETNGFPKAAHPHIDTDKTIESEQRFLQRITQECRRTERSKQKIVLLLIEGPSRVSMELSVARALMVVTRETDIMGWIHAYSTLGILFTELGGASLEDARATILAKVEDTLERAGFVNLRLSAFILPYDLNQKGPDDSAPGDGIYKHLWQSTSEMKFKLAIKRAIDIVGSGLLLICFSPFMVLVAILVKFGSPGPVLFRQIRVGQRGKRFSFLKFRSMRVATDCSLHENYVKDFIRGTAEKNMDENGVGVFKLTNDPRVTKFGSFIRRTSLDELPQLWNVFCGDMALVGPRPPIPYEVECYDLWHQRRLLEVKPGITGLWQIRGRSRTGFDEMVRLDLQYARTWSPWLDVKILLQTPLAVFRAGGAH